MHILPNSVCVCCVRACVFCSHSNLALSAFYRHEHRPFGIVFDVDAAPDPNTHTYTCARIRLIWLSILWEGGGRRRRHSINTRQRTRREMEHIRWANTALCCIWCVRVLCMCPHACHVTREALKPPTYAWWDPVTYAEIMCLYTVHYCHVARLRASRQWAGTALGFWLLFVLCCVLCCVWWVFTVQLKPVQYRHVIRETTCRPVISHYREPASGARTQIPKSSHSLLLMSAIKHARDAYLSVCMMIATNNTHTQYRGACI